MFPPLTEEVFIVVNSHHKRHFPSAARTPITDITQNHIRPHTPKQSPTPGSTTEETMGQERPPNALPFSGLGAAKPALRFYADASAATRSAATAVLGQ
jgi:hypothetical protein